MNYKFDAMRYCKNNQGRLKLPDGSDPMDRIAEELRRARELLEAVRNTFVVYDRMAPSLKNYCAARAEVDRLIADCEGEG